LGTKTLLIEVQGDGAAAGSPHAGLEEIAQSCLHILEGGMVLDAPVSRVGQGKGFGTKIPILPKDLFLFSAATNRSKVFYTLIYIQK